VVETFACGLDEDEGGEHMPSLSEVFQNRGVPGDTTPL
jgi:hypothetical protein